MKKKEIKKRIRELEALLSQKEKGKKKKKVTNSPKLVSAEVPRRTSSNWWRGYSDYL